MFGFSNYNIKWGRLGEKQVARLETNIFGDKLSFGYPKVTWMKIVSRWLGISVFSSGVESGFGSCKPIGIIYRHVTIYIIKLEYWFRSKKPLDTYVTPKFKGQERKESLWRRPKGAVCLRKWEKGISKRRNWCLSNAASVQ